MADQRSVPAVIWDEKPLSGAGQARRIYPAQDGAGVWGWTTKHSEATGIVDEDVDGVLGFDDSTTVGGLVVLRFGSVIRVLH